MKILVTFLFFTLVSVNIVYGYYGIDDFFNYYMSPSEVDNNSIEDEKEIDKEYDFVKRVEDYGYTAEEYTVQSKDGYNLKLHRISGGPQSSPQFGKKVVFLQHGLAMWSLNYIIRGPGNDLVFLLVDRGYDVWLGNARGNEYSKSNNKISRMNDSFWNFSYHEVALYDVSLFIDEVLRLTEQRKLIYIGFSLGTAESFVLFSSLPKYNDKVYLIIDLAPIAFWKNNNKGLLVKMEKIWKMLNKYSNFQEIFTLKSGKSKKCTYWCRQLTLFFQPELDPRRFNETTIKNLDKTFPAGTSMKTIFHLFQNMNSGLFAAYDYGTEKNEIIYGTSNAPEYSLRNITAPIALYHAEKDDFTTDKDVELLSSYLPNVVRIKKVPDPEWTHADFIWGIYAKELVYYDIIDLISEYVNK